MITIPMEVSTNAVSIPMSVTDNALTFDAELDLSYTFVPAQTYTGAVEVTPSSEVQTLRTDGLLMDSNITINPIPSNYGLITWNGSTLTVS